MSVCVKIWDNYILFSFELKKSKYKLLLSEMREILGENIR